MVVAKRIFSRILVLSLFLVHLPLTLATERPNVIIVFVDDMGWSDLSCFNGKRAKTDNIDQLASEGLRFENFYVNSPICSPSRVALSTGQYPQRWRISSYLAARKLNRDRGMSQWLDPSAPMLARELQNSGYATGHFGKWHMGGQRDVGEAPLISEYGFDRSLTNFEGLGARVLPLKDAYDGKPPKKHDLGSAALGRGPITWSDRSVITNSFVEAALAFIDDANSKNKPFYINLWPDDVHSPFFPPKAMREKTDQSKRELYYAVLKSMDDQLGRLFDRVRNDPSLHDNTLILLMSDNGHEEGAGSSDPLRGAKTWLYEGGVRSPLIVWGPGMMDEGVANGINRTSVLCALDVNRSIYELTQTKLPANAQLDGENLAATLLGKERKTRRQPIFWRRPPDRPGTPQDDNPDLAVRDGDWKYYVNYDGTDRQLYDLTDDPSESNNVIGANDKVANRLQDLTEAWNQTMPVDAGDPNWEGKQTIGSLLPSQFINPIAEGADPWVIRDPLSDCYRWCMSEGNRAIAIHTSENLTSLGEKTIVWSAPEDGPLSDQIWAPELHFLDDRWHIYFAASDGDNKNHLTYVLRSTSADPLGDYEVHGPLATGNGPDGRSPNLWSIDMTVLQLKGKRYAVWSGWDGPETDQQFLYIAPMKSPTELSGPRVRLCANDDYLWERIEPDESKRGLNEGPQVFQAKGRTAIVFSCGASWLPTYKLGLLELVGENALEPSDWKKRPAPVFTSANDAMGVGHSCFVASPDGKQRWHIFHAKRDPNPGWRRVVHAQPMRIGKRGFPLFGKPLPNSDVLERPSGEVVGTMPGSVTLFGDDASKVDWSYYGHHQFIDHEDTDLALGRIPPSPINEYRCGEKVVINDWAASDVLAEVTIDFAGNPQARDAGILFRCSGASVGYDAQRSYFVGLIPKTKRLVVGKTDGTNWKELGRAPAAIDVDQPQHLSVRVVDQTMTVRHNGKESLVIVDGTFRDGAIGLRVVDTFARFSNLRIEELKLPKTD